MPRLGAGGGEGEVLGDRTPATGAAWASLGLYALAHAAVDAVCVGLLWQAYHDEIIGGATAWSAFFIYNLLAFALQPLVGAAVDRLHWARRGAALGGGLVVLAAALAAVPAAFFAGLVLMGVGNAIFHVGGGIVSLRFAPGRATPLGFFVAPGAGGVLIGTLIGRDGDPVWVVAVALLLLTAGLLAAPVPRLSVGTLGNGRLACPPSAVELTIKLVLFVVAVRSYVGMALSFPWKSELWLLVLLTAGVIAGKALGGALADRLGWRAVGVGALLASVPLLAVGGQSAAAGIAGVLVFNMTMPVTLAAAARSLPGHDGFAFGLTCLALFVGSVPVLVGWTEPISPLALLLTAALAAIALWVGLSRLLDVPILPRRAAGDSVIEGSSI